MARKHAGDARSVHQELVRLATEADESEGGYLLAHILRFGRLLRLMGAPVRLSQMLDLVAALAHVPITHRTDFYHTARSLLVNRREDFLVFDQAFNIFWQAASRVMLKDQRRAEQDEVGKRLRLPAKTDSRKQQDEGAQLDFRNAQLLEERADKEPSTQRLMIHSAQETLRHKDFGEMTWEEIQEAKRAISSLKWKLGQRRTRRYGSGSRGRLHLRRMMRQNLRYGGEPIRLAFRQRTWRPRSLVVLCDISGSMERYSRMLLHFTHVLTHGLRDVSTEAFVFGTRLTRITRNLRYKDVDEALDELAHAVQDWSGGTRIGWALKTFNFRWARRVLTRGAVALIISDGWDRGENDLLLKEMARLQRSAYRLIWLNPLLGSEEYRPIQRGMATALPYVDDFLAVHNLHSLEQLAETLSSISKVRPQRKRHAHLRQDDERSSV